MSKIFLFIFVGFLVCASVFSISTASAAEVIVNQNNTSISKEEIVILQQSLLALTMVLTDLKVTLAKSENLPPNTAQIIVNLSNIGKSLAQISATMEKRGLAVAMPEAATPQAPLVAIQKVSEEVVNDSVEAAILESGLAESENQSESQLETLLGESGAEKENQRTLVASIGAITSQRITWIIAVILVIGAVLFWKMKGGQEAIKTS